MIFGAPDLCRSTPPIDPASWLPGQGHNDLEPVACQAFAEVGKVLERLREEAPQALMTGSGACVFAGFSTCKEAEAVLQRLPKTWSSWIAKGFDAHPLSDL